MAKWRSGLIGTAVLLSGLAFAPAGLLAQGNTAGSPVTDTHVSGSWAVRCYRAANSGCDLTQAVFTRDKRLRVATIAIGYIPKSNQYFGRFVVPLGVSFAQGLTIEFGAFRAPHLKYHRCERDGCYVEGVLPQAFINAMLTPDLDKGAMGVVAIDGRKFEVPIVLNGFSDGLSLLKEWTDQKAGDEK